MGQGIICWEVQQQRTRNSRTPGDRSAHSDHRSIIKLLLHPKQLHVCLVVVRSNRDRNMRGLAQRRVVLNLLALSHEDIWRATQALCRSESTPGTWGMPSAVYTVNVLTSKPQWLMAASILSATAYHARSRKKPRRSLARHTRRFLSARNWRDADAQLWRRSPSPRRADN